MNWNHKLRRVLVTGMSGSGKSSLQIYLLKTWPEVRWRFVFDPDREFAHKLDWPVAIDDAEVVRLAAQFRPVCFDPIPMFGPELEDGLAWFCNLVLCMSRKVNGGKLLVIDEIWKYAGRVLPAGLRAIMHEGRRQEIDTLIVSQQLNETNSTLRAHVTELWTFKQDEELPLDWLKRAGFKPEEVASLRYPGGFIKKDRLKNTFSYGQTNRSGVPTFGSVQSDLPKLKCI